MDFQVFELRRYTIQPGEREHFALYFESYFPEAFQQLGAIAAGAFFERANPAGFTWIRGFRTIEDRAVANASLYYGPVWKEHKKTMNDLMVDSDNVLLLTPLSPQRSIPILPAVDPVREAAGAQGIVVAQIFALQPDGAPAASVAAATTTAATTTVAATAATAADVAEPIFADYRAAGARETGVLITLDVANNFPQLPIRTDGPYLVWLGILPNDQTLETAFMPLAERGARALAASGILRGAPELVILEPTRRSRLRWLP